MTATTTALQARLWRMYGDRGHPAEWDGQVYGGGKLSQRFWEYHKTIERLELTADSVVLDIGGGSPVTGLSLLAKVLAPTVKRVIVVDPALPEAFGDYPNVVGIRAAASYGRLSAVFDAHPDISHVASVSVFEHIPPADRLEILRAIDDCCRGDTVVMTIEFHETERFFEEQLTTASLSELFGRLTRFMPVSIEASPLRAENALRAWPPLYARLLGRFGIALRWREPERTPPIPLWKPLVLKFVRMPADTDGTCA